MARPIALLGGAFDPPHNGHLAIADAAVRALPVDEVAFLIAGSPPHKRTTGASPQQRLAMLRAAVSNRSEFRVDTRELERPGPTYLIDTLRELRDCSPRRVVYFLVGIDAARNMKNWRGVEEIFRLCIPVPVARPGFGDELRPQDVPFLSDAARGALNGRLLKDPYTSICSSEIRRLVAGSRSASVVRDLVPASVLEFIEAQRVYLRAGGDGTFPARDKGA